MKFTCDRCDAQYMISDEKVGPNGVKVRCKKCSHVILVRKAVENGAAAAEAPVPAPAPAPGSGPGLDAELGQAFDNAFGDGPAKASSPGPDPDATQAVPPEEAASMAARAAPPEPAATEWYVAIGQAQVGPLPLVEVRRKWEAGDVGPDSLVWRPGMGDWAPLTGVSDLAAYLAPVARAAARPQQQPVAAPAATRTATAAAPEPRRAQDVSWKPVGASALAALASEEIARPGEPKPEQKPVVSARSLVDGLPDGGGVDPTGAVPLTIKALESTGEAPVARSGVARGAEQLRKKRSSTRALLTVVVLLVLALVGVGGYVGYDQLLRPRQAAPAQPAPVAAEKPAEPAAKPAEPATATATAPATPAAPAAQPQPPPEPVPAAPAAAPAEPESTASATPPPAPAPPPAVKEPAKPKPEPTRPVRTARVERKATPKPERVATREEPPPKAAPQPASQPAKKKGGDLLDFDSNDAALDDALGGKGSGRSVYVPPAPGGGEAPADRVTDSQITETIMTRVSALQQCAADRSSGSGVLKMNWAINPDGSVRNLKCVSPEFASTPFASCVSNLIKGLKFPKSTNGRSDVTFPFKF